MQKQISGMSCQLGSWALAAGVGLLTFILLLVLGNYGWIGAIFMAAVVFAFLGVVFGFLFCRELPAPRGAGNIGRGIPPAPVPDPAPTTAPRTAPKAAAAPAPVAQATPATDQSKAPTSETGSDATQAGEGTKPAVLTQARDSGADNLKEIKGVGPKLERMLNSMGFYHFDQIADWTASEQAWVDENLEGFKGRVSRDEWVKQAKILSAGRDTEFSKRVEGGDVY